MSKRDTACLKINLQSYGGEHMKKSVTAIIMVFALLVSFAACQRLPEDTEGFVVESKAYYVDGEGVTRNVESETDEKGKTVYYYMDANGNKVTLKKKDVVVESTKIRETEKESFSLTPEEQSFFDIYNNPEAFDQLIDSSMTVPELDLSDEAISEEKFEEIEVELDSSGKPVHENVEKTYEEIMKGNEFTVDVVFKGIVNGTTTTVPMKASRDGDKVYIETAIPVEGQGSLKCNIIMRDGKCYFVLPAMRAYMAAPVESMDEIFTEDFFATSEQDTRGNYVSSAEVVLEGKTYICDIYESNGATSKEYYLDGNLKRVEVINGEDDITIIQFNEVSEKVDKSVFKVPTHYMDMSRLMNMSDVAA